MPLTSTQTPTPTNYLVILYHAHQLLDWAGPLDILSTVSKQQPQPSSTTANYGAITITTAAEDLGPINLTTVPPPNASWSYETSPDLPGPSAPRANLTLKADLRFDDALASLGETGEVSVVNERGERESRSIDVVLIPGGVGSRMYRVSKGTGEKVLNVQSAVDFVRAICEGGWVRSAVLTVCTGSDLLARTGVLEGRRATTNHMAFQVVSARHAGVEWLAKRRWVRSLPGEVAGSGGQGEGKEKGGRVVFEREVWTSAGISAGMDLMLWFVAEVYGRDFAKNIARRLEYEWREGVGEGEVDPFY